MSVGVIVEFNFKPDGTEEVINAFKERLPHTRKWDGCEDIYLGVDSDDPNHLVLVERWESREIYDKYVEWAMAQPGAANVMQYLVGEMTTLYLDDSGG